MKFLDMLVKPDYKVLDKTNIAFASFLREKDINLCVNFQLCS